MPAAPLSLAPRPPVSRPIRRCASRLPGRLATSTVPTVTRSTSWSTHPTRMALTATTTGSGVRPKPLRSHEVEQRVALLSREPLPGSVALGCWGADHPSTGGGIPNCQRAQVSERRNTSSVRLSRTGDREPEDGALPAPEKFNTFNTLTIFVIVDPALAYPTLVHCQAPHAPSLSQCTIPTTLPPLLQAARRAGYPRRGWRVGGEGKDIGRAVGVRASALL